MTLDLLTNALSSSRQSPKLGDEQQITVDVNAAVPQDSFCRVTTQHQQPDNSRREVDLLVKPSVFQESENSLSEVTTPPRVPSGDRAVACDALRQWLIDFEENEIIRNLQSEFVAAVLAAEGSDTLTLDKCFDKACASFFATHPQKYWRNLVDVFRQEYVEQASRILIEVGVA